MIDVFKMASKGEKRLSGVNGRIASEIYGQVVAGYFLDLVDNGVEEARKNNPGGIDVIAEFIIDEMYNSFFVSFAKQVRFIGRKNLRRIIDIALTLDRIYCKEFDDYCVQVLGMESMYR